MQSSLSSCFDLSKVEAAVDTPGCFGYRGWARRRLLLADNCICNSAVEIYLALRNILNPLFERF